MNLGFLVVATAGQIAGVGPHQRDLTLMQFFQREEIDNFSSSIGK